MSEEKLTEAQKIIAYYGQRCALQNGNGSTTPGVDFNNAVDAIGSLINQQVIQALERVKNESYGEDGKGNVLGPMSTLERLIKEYKGE